MSAELETAFYRLYQHRPDLKVCEANKKLLLAHCDSKLDLPTAKNLIHAAAEIDAQLAHIEPAEREIPVTSAAAVAAVAPPAPAPESSEPTEADLRKMSREQLREYLRKRDTKKLRLPDHYDAETLRNLPNSALTPLYMRYGSEAIKARLAGKF